jgi:hypothetical protein
MFLKMYTSMLYSNLIKKSVILSVLFMSWAFSSFGQNTVSTTGGHFKSTGGSASFAVGQVSYVLKKRTGPYLNGGV